MYSYFAYGLGIKSELLLPEFTDQEVEGEVFIRLKNVRPHSELDEAIKPYLKMNQEKSIIALDKLGVFIIRNGREIDVFPEFDTDMRHIRRFIVGTAMAILLYQRGFLVLHASTINYENQAIAFVGLSGSGKSSIAAAMHTRDYGVLTDDVTVIDMCGNQPKVIPGFPQLKLGLESVEAIGFDLDNNLLSEDLDDKFSYRLDHHFTYTPLPLRRIYVLEENQHAGIELLTGIELLSQQSAVIKLICFSLPTLWTQIKDHNHFLQCIELANRVPTYLLNRNSKIYTLPQFAEIVDGHLRGSAG